jgi:hypothetical protein
LSRNFGVLGIGAKFLVTRQQTNIQTQGFDPFFNLFSPQFPWLSSVELITKGKFESLS